MPEAIVFEALRTPRGRGKEDGSLYTVRPMSLLVTVMRALVERTGVDTRAIEDLLIGCVTQTGEQGSCLARFAVLEAGWAETVPAVTLNRFCASGLDAVHQAAALVASGTQDLVVAGGLEHMSRVTMGSDGGAWFDATTGAVVGTVPQGISADLLATLEGVSRQQADAWALESHRRAVVARERGAFDRSVVPVLDENGFTLLARDEGPRSDTSMEALGRLKPSFEVFGTRFGLDSLARRRYPAVERLDHVHTAGNSSAIVDGAAAVLVGSERRGRELGLRPRARIRGMAVVGTEPVLMLTGPVPATEKALARAGMGWSDVDLFEVNEAFAAVPIVFCARAGVDPARVNVHGGAIALGHPLGATGAMLLGTLLDTLEERDLSTGVVTLCAGGGMGIATVLERV